MQKLVGEVTTGEKQGYVRMVIEAVKDCGVLFGGKKIGDKLFVLMSHGDEAVKLTDGFAVVENFSCLLFYFLHSLFFFRLLLFFLLRVFK